MNDRNATNDGLIPIQPEDLEKVSVWMPSSPLDTLTPGLG
jgi:hypothetical protein